MGKKPTPWSLFFILQISVHIACCQSPLKAMRPHLLRVQHHLAPKHELAPQPFPQPALLSFQEAVASPDHSSSSPRVGRGSCPEKAPGFAVAQGQQAQTCLHRDSHIRPVPGCHQQRQSLVCMNHAEPAASAHDLLALMPAHRLPHPGSSGHLKKESEDSALPWHGWEAASCPMLAKRKRAAILCLNRATSHRPAAPMGPKNRGGRLLLLELAP